MLHKGITKITNRPLYLALGGKLSSYQISWTRVGSLDKPIIYIMPSMSHDGQPSSAGVENEIGWWDNVIGYGSDKGIDLEKFSIISASPLGGPYGTSSPLTDGINFPQITPADQAACH